MFEMFVGEYLIFMHKYVLHFVKSPLTRQTSPTWTSDLNIQSSNLSSSLISSLDRCLHPNVRYQTHFLKNQLRYDASCSCQAVFPDCFLGRSLRLFNMGLLLLLGLSVDTTAGRILHFGNASIYPISVRKWLWNKIIHVKAAIHMKQKCKIFLWNMKLLMSWNKVDITRILSLWLWNKTDISVNQKWWHSTIFISYHCGPYTRNNCVKYFIVYCVLSWVFFCHSIICHSNCWKVT